MTLDEQYQKVIDDQRTHLLKLQADFNKVCEDAKVNAQTQLKTIPADDKEAREAVLQEQKETLDAALEKLKSDIGESTRHTMHSLERIVREKELSILKELEDELASL